MNPIENWFQSKAWNPFSFQRDTWATYAAGRNGLLHAPTGTGKTYAVWMGPVREGLEQQAQHGLAKGLRALWVTPLRALAADIGQHLQAPLTELGLKWTLDVRTGDSSASMRARHKKGLPNALVTTPESLSVLISANDAVNQFKNLNVVVVDEWHELLGTKRGTQMELALARLRTWKPDIKIWGLSATLGNLDQARDVLLGPGTQGEIIHADVKKKSVIEGAIPPSIERFPWAGHLGSRMLPTVVEAIEAANSTLVFTNTRSQAELWYQSLLNAKPEWAETMRIHHGSLDREERDEVENGLRDGKYKCVVCTSSLDLGVDFAPVDRVIQIGSPKGVARLLQRAGRSGHQPGGTSRVLCVPTHAMELAEISAARRAADKNIRESRVPVERPLDVLAQHMVTVALGGGFEEQALWNEVRSTYAYRDLSKAEWEWTLAFVTTGGVLKSYPEYRRVTESDGVFRVESAQVAKRHRMSIGTITSDGMIQIKFARGRSLGLVEENFVARLKRGDRFAFAGRRLELMQLRDGVAYVKLATKPVNSVPRYLGGRLPLSDELGQSLREVLHQADLGHFDDPETQCVRPLLEVQKNWSKLPAPDELLIEKSSSREGTHYFCFPFAGRMAHEGLAALVSYRLSKITPITFSMSMNDYGFELASRTASNFTKENFISALSLDNLTDDIAACMNAAEMARRQFREIARVAGLVFTGFPWQRKTGRQLQVSSGLVFDVLRQYDAGNLLLRQADREVLERQLEVSRLRAALQQLDERRVVFVNTDKFTPLSFPLWAQWIQQQVSSESWMDRVQRAAELLEKEAQKQMAAV